MANNLKNDFNLGIKLTQSNGPLSTSQIVSHFVNHYTSQNDKVQFDCTVALDMYKIICPIDMVVFLHLLLLGIL